MLCDTMSHLCTLPIACVKPEMVNLGAFLWHLSFLHTFAQTLDLLSSIFQAFSSPRVVSPMRSPPFCEDESQAGPIGTPTIGTHVFLPAGLTALTEEPAPAPPCQINSNTSSLPLSGLLHISPGQMQTWWDADNNPKIYQFLHRYQSLHHQFVLNQKHIILVPCLTPDGLNQISKKMRSRSQISSSGPFS